MAVAVYAPASIGNLGVGFDILGAALKPIDGSLLGDVVEVDDSISGEFELTASGRFAHKLPDDPKQNILYDCFVGIQTLLAEQGTHVGAVKMHLHKNLPIGSGLGSSASSIVAAVAALNQFFGSPLNEEAQLRLMGDLEGQISGSIHYDNVAPCFVGGIQLMTELDHKLCSTLPSPKSWYWCSAYPGITVSTAEARSILPAHYSKADIIKHGRLLANFVHALYAGDDKLAVTMMEDVIAEPYRKVLLPGFESARQALLKLGALAVGISGSGPTLFAVCDDISVAKQCDAYLAKHYLQNEDGFSHICRIDEAGVANVEIQSETTHS
ncbi:homoserine kinase [Echinimonas agarilytica]|uniref:Homoserine kinase n=1 Tax=Echinimonas agarilytica TaxID=1215918 RepID=A0AA41W5F9_9GAMM|nr:homoserine kinase [Echinimonas agarilytica]MCM2678857.1 homoserine kinase [Echinimonas agarilytica]